VLELLLDNQPNLNILLESIQMLPHTDRVCRLCFAIVFEAGIFATMI
jgi:hypothetical protein